jgi:hypothetical protein
MHPIWFEGGKEMQSLSDHIKSVNWTLNLNYWTAGRQQGCWGEWGWCHAASGAALADDLLWLPGQPDNDKEGCVHLRIFANGSKVALSDRNCSSKFAIACKVNTFLDIIYSAIRIY